MLRHWVPCSLDGGLTAVLRGNRTHGPAGARHTVQWREQDADYIRRRSVRYSADIGIEPQWTVEAAADPRRIVRDPDPKSRSSAIRVIGYSPSAGFVVTVIATLSDYAGVTAWKDHRHRLARVRRAEHTMTETDHNSRIDTEVKAVREQYAEEEAEAAELEIAGGTRRSTCR